MFKIKRLMCGYLNIHRGGRMCEECRKKGWLCFHGKPHPGGQPGLGPVSFARPRLIAVRKIVRIKVNEFLVGG